MSTKYPGAHSSYATEQVDLSSKPDAIRRRASAPSHRHAAHGISATTDERRTEDGRDILYVVFEAARLVAVSQDDLR